MIKWIIGLVLVIAAGVAIWWSGVLTPYLSMGSAQSPATTTAETTQPTAQAPKSDLPSASGDSSDTAVAQDSAAVDAQLKALSSDSSNVDSDFSDKPVSQEF